MADQHAAIAEHYGSPGLAERILDGRQTAGRDPKALTVDDLAPVDEFHIRGRAATAELADLAGLEPGWNLLDVGCGLGGPARYLAERCGVRVVGVDLTPEYCRTARVLVERTGLTDRVEIREADALDLPLPDGSFDCVWTQHASMNIADKTQLFQEMRRVVRRGGRLALYDIVAGAGEEVVFPVPWARKPSISFLVQPSDLRRLVEAANFDILVDRDDSAAALDWFRERLATISGQATPPPIGLHLLLGADTKAMFANQVRNLEEDRIRLIQLVAVAT